MKKSRLINHHLQSASYRPILYFASNFSLLLVHKQQTLEYNFSIVFRDGKRVAFDWIVLCAWLCKQDHVWQPLQLLKLVSCNINLNRKPLSIVLAANCSLFSYTHYPTFAILCLAKCVHLVCICGVKKIKILNCNFHSQITDHVTVLISEQFLESWLDHFPLAKLAKREVQINK